MERSRKTGKVKKGKVKHTKEHVKHAKHAKHAKNPEKEKKAKGPGKKERVEILKKFTKLALDRYGSIMKSIVLFGSTARGGSRHESDIDVFVIIDDTKQKITPSMKAKIEDDLLVMAKKCNKQMSVQQPYLLTEFWAMVRDGHPIVFNFIREGVPVYDKDIFLPIKRLLQMGEIRPSKEAVEKYIERGPKRIRRVENAKIYMVVEDLYYAMLESCQAVLMFLGKTPPRPSDAADAMKKFLVDTKFVDERFAKDLQDIIFIRKEVEHKRIKGISGVDLDAWISKAKNFVKTMQKLIVRIEILKREGIIEKSLIIMKETVVTLLKAMNKPPKAGEPISSAFERNLVKTGLIPENYLEIYNDLDRMMGLVKEGKVMDLPKQHILMQREYVRKFIREAGRVMKEKMNAKPKPERKA
jgi:predicted nucleotidyltransferase